MSARRLWGAAAALLCAGSAAGSMAVPAVAHPYPSRLLVYAQEWSLAPSRPTVPAGPVVVQLWNRGMDAHDLRIRRIGGRGMMTGRALEVRLTSPGAVSTARWTLRPGRYELYCSMPGHMARGMRARLRVTPR